MAEMGRPPHAPTEESRKQVADMISFGITRPDVAKCLSISEDTLLKYYANELATAAQNANSKVAGRLFQKAMDGDTASMIFWLKTRARWSESVNLNHTVAEAQLTDREILERFLKGAKGHAGEVGKAKKNDASGGA